VELGLQGRTREELAVLVPEYLLAGHLIDRAGMPHLIAAFGRDEMRDIAIEEWMGASPIYTKRMQQALDFEGDSVETIFKGLQLDIGAPPQFMDFRYRLIDHDRGEFWLDHCGALKDVEPMGSEYVVAMCHDIEDPTFDATAIATNPYAQVRPIHRPPRVPADRVPVCHWRVTIDAGHDALPVPVEAEVMSRTRAATVALTPIDPADPGQHDYSGPLLADLRFSEWSRSALLRIAEEACLQGHLLALSGALATRARADADQQAFELVRKQFTGVAGVAAERIRLALGLGPSIDDAAQLLRLHPALLPDVYVGCDVQHSDRLLVQFDSDSGAEHDRAWTYLLDAEHLRPLNAIVHAVNPRFRCEAMTEDQGGLTVEVVVGDVEAPVAEEVLLTRFSTGTTFVFEDRGTPVEIRRS
jgi:hypothetical protein